jgi:N-ethylmaleimide reductase
VRDGSDKRADVYGEPVENRARFLLEVVEAMVSLWAGNRVAVPNWVQRNINGMSDCNPEVRLPCSATEQFRTCVPPPDRTSNQGERSIEEDLPPDSVARLRKIFEGEIIAAGGFAVAQRRWWKRATLTWSYFWSPAECI